MDREIERRSLRRRLFQNKPERRNFAPFLWRINFFYLMKILPKNAQEKIEAILLLEVTERVAVVA